MALHFLKGGRSMTFAEKMDAYMDAYAELYLFSGMLRVTHRDQIIYQRNVGYADFEHKTPFTEKSLFTLYSISKQFCAIGALLLYDRGLLDLDVHPSRYLPEVAGAHPELTVRHLLHHTSGLCDLAGTESLKYRSADKPDMRQAVAYFASLPHQFQPGTQCQYCNINFTILALIIENLSGMAYADYIARYVFAPLGMKTARVDDNKLVLEDRVRGYDFNGPDLVSTSRLPPRFGIGAADVIATVDDVYRLNHAIKHRLLLKPATWQLLLTPSALGPYAMGCQVAQWHGKTRIQQNGGHNGFRTLHIYVPEDDLDIILLSNTGFGIARGSVVDAIHTAFYGEAGGTTKADSMDTGYIEGVYRPVPEGFMPARRPAIELTPQQEADFLGRYADAELTRQPDGTYCFLMGGSKRVCCYPIAPDMMTDMYIDASYRLTQTKDGQFHFLGRAKLS